MAGTVPEERADPLYEVWAHTLAAEEGEQGQGFYVIQATFYIEEEGGDLVAETVKGLNVVLQHEGSVGRASPWRGATLKGMN